MIADVIATPQTVPRERIRYTVEAETAWSDKFSHGSTRVGLGYIPEWSNAARKVKRIPG